MPTSFNDQLARWDALNTNLKPQLVDLPHLQKGQEEFEALLRKGFEIAAQQHHYTGLFRQIIVERNKLEAQAKQLADFIASGLRHAFGSKSQKLHEFGVKPRIRRRIKKEEEPVPGGAEPSATPASPSSPSA